MRRLVVALLTLAFPATAGAHGGTTVISGSNAAYDLSVQAADVITEDGRKAVDLTAYPIRRGNGAPDLDADLRLTIDGGRTIQGTRNGDGIEAIVPVSERGEWRTWTIAATVSGTAGRLSLTGEPVSAQEESLPPALIPVSVVLAVLAIGYARLVQRRRSKVNSAGTT